MMGAKRILKVLSFPLLIYTIYKDRARAILGLYQDLRKTSHLKSSRLPLQALL